MEKKKKWVKWVVLVIIVLCLRWCDGVLDKLDAKYGDTIPIITYQQNHAFNKKIYERDIRSKHVSIYVAYPENINQVYPEMYKTDLEVFTSWKPYLKNDNEVIIALKINHDDSMEYKFLGNTGPYAAADSARKAVMAAKVGANTLKEGESIILVYKFIVSGQ